MKRRQLLAGLAVALVVAIAGCSAAAPTATPTRVPQPTAAPTPTPASPTAAPTAPTAPTAAQIAELGTVAYRRSCATCHDGGFAPPLAQGLVRFANAQAMFSYSRIAMPQNAPGTLKPEEYFQIVVSMLVEQKVLAPDAAVSIADLPNILFQQ